MPSTSRINKQVWKDMWMGRIEPVNSFAETLVETIGKKPVKILDVGCGNGTDSIFFAAHGYAVTAIDFSESGIAALQKTANEVNVHIDASLHDISQTMKFADGTFDVVYAHLSVHYFDDTTTRRVFADMGRVLKPGGKLFVKCKSVDDPLYGKGEKVGDDMFKETHIRHFFSMDYMRSMLEGFTIDVLQKSSAKYHGKTSAFIEAIATK
jgi:SAM-dependent methyltransferase